MLVQPFSLHNKIPKYVVEDTRFNETVIRAVGASQFATFTAATAGHNTNIFGQHQSRVATTTDTNKAFVLLRIKYPTNTTNHRSILL